MSVPVIIVGLYGLLSLVGGVIGYAKAKSAASLIAGSISGVILIACAAGLQQGQPYAAIAALIVSLALGGRFFGVWRLKRRVMPDLLMVLGAALTVIAAGSALLR